MSDPRLGLTSASNALYDTLCPGRHLAQRGIPEPERDADDDAAIGTRLHQAYANTLPVGAEPLDSEESETIARAWEIDARATKEWLERMGFEPGAPLTTIREERFWVRDENGNPLHSGQPDLVRMHKGETDSCDILIGDLKSLWGEHDSADLNLQLRDYASVLYLDPRIKVCSVSVYINQPARPKDFKLVTYELLDLIKASSDMLQRVDKSNRPDAPRVAGPLQCKYCRAKLGCRQHMEMVTKLPMEITGQLVPDKVQIQSAVGLMPNDKLARLLGMRSMLEQCAEALNAEGKRRLREDPASLPGWQLKDGVTKRKITNAKLVFQRLANIGVSAEEFTSVCSLPIKAVTELVKAKTGAKGAALDERADDAIKGAVTETKNDATLEATK